MGVALAVVIALVALGLINRFVYGPDGQVRAYFSAVREGDGSKALGILGVEAPDASAAMLTGDALKASFAELKNLETSQVEVLDGGEKARVTVAYELAGEPGSTVFETQKVGSHWGVFDQWHIVPQELPVLEVSSGAVEAATLNGTKVPLKQGEGTFAVFYPGHYTVTYESALFSAVSESVSVTSASQDASQLSVELQPSEAAVASVQQQVNTYLSSCATQDSLYPTGCPFELAFDGRVDGGVAWEISEYPEVEVSLSQGKWTLAPAQGTAKISFTELDLFTGKKKQVVHSVPFTVTGSLTVANDAVIFKAAA